MSLVPQNYDKVEELSREQVDRGMFSMQDNSKGGVGLSQVEEIEEQVVQCKGCRHVLFEKFVNTNHGPVAQCVPRTSAQWLCCSCMREAPDRYENN